MRVILLQTIPSLGQRGEVKDVREGYARNFLFPKKMAVVATEKEMLNLRREKEETNERSKKSATKLAHAYKKIENKIFTFRAKANEQGHLFAKIRENTIALFLEEQGYHVDPKKIILQDSIRMLGEYQIELRLKENKRVYFTLQVNKETV